MMTSRCCDASRDVARKDCGGVEHLGVCIGFGRIFLVLFFYNSKTFIGGSEPIKLPLHTVLSAW